MFEGGKKKKTSQVKIIKMCFTTHTLNLFSTSGKFKNTTPERQAVEKFLLKLSLKQW